MEKSICFGPNFGKWLATLLTGNPDDFFVNTLVSQAANGQLTDDDLFLKLAEKYGGSNLFKAIHSLVSEKKQDELPGKTEIKSVCGVCITPGILGRIISMKQQYSGEDSKFVEGIINKISLEEITIEDALTELITKLGKSFVDGFTQMNKDTDTVYAEAKRKALERNPGLKVV